MAKLIQDQVGGLIPKEPDQVSEPWDPALSKRLESVLEALTDLYKRGTLNYELRPLTLMNLGDDFAKLYQAGFRREGRPRWAEQAYPKGFQDLVEQLNQRLQKEGISVLDTKRNVPPYKKLPQDQSAVVSGLSRLYLEGQCTREEVVEELEAHTIKLSPSSFERYFPNQLPKAEEKESLNRHKDVAAISKRIEDLKKALDFDLSIDSCLRGLIFENFVGAYLVDLYGRDAVENQKKVSIAYRDLDGNPHSYVLCDFTVHSQPVEVKLRNPYENIITSALAQSYAIQGLEGTPTKVSIICRSTCPFMLMAYHDNVAIREEAEAMGLTDHGFVERKLKDVVSYQTFDEILASDPNGVVWKQRLSAIERILDNESTNGLKKAARYLGHVAKAPDGISTRLDIAIECLKKNRELSTEEQRRILGGITVMDKEQRKSFEEHVQLLIRRVDQTRETLVLGLYNFMHGSQHEKLTAAHLKELLNLDPTRFNDGCLNWLAAREKARLERISKATSNPNQEELSVIAAYERSRERHFRFRREEVFRQFQGLEDEFLKLEDRFKRAKRYTETFEIREKSGKRLLRLLEGDSNWPRGKRQQQRVFDSMRVNRGIQNKARDNVRRFLGDVMKGISQWNRMNPEDRMSEQQVVNALGEALRTQTQQLAIDKARIRNSEQFRLSEKLNRTLAHDASKPNVADKVLASDSLYALTLDIEQHALDCLALFVRVKQVSLDINSASSAVNLVSLSQTMQDADDPFNFSQITQANLLATLANLSGSTELAFDSRGALLAWAGNNTSHRPPLEKYVGAGDSFMQLTLVRGQVPEILMPFMLPHQALTSGDIDFRAYLQEINPQAFSELENAIETTREQLIAYLDSIKAYCAFSLDPDTPISVSKLKRGEFEMVRLAFPENVSGLRNKDGEKLMNAVYEFGAQSHVLSNILLCDYWVRKCGQARILSFYSPAVAKDFFLHPHLTLQADDSFTSVCERGHRASQAADTDFEQLLYGTRVANNA